MKFKNVLPTEFSYLADGRIYIDQVNEHTKDVDRIYLTPEQLRAISKWYFENKSDVDGHWNMGVEE